MFAARRLVRSATTASRQARNMAHAPVPTEGIDGLVRKYLPGDHHLALAIIGFYGTVYAISTSLPSSEKPAAAPAAAPVAAPATAAGEIPSIESPDFENWIAVEGNLEKFFTA